jgi:hypothetical protein
MNYLEAYQEAVSVIEDRSVRGALVARAITLADSDGPVAALDNLRFVVHSGLWVELCSEEEQIEMLELLASEEEIKELERMYR